MVEQKVANVPMEVGLRYASFETRLVAFVLDAIVLFSVLALFFVVAFLQILLRSDFGEVDPPDSAFYLAAIILLVYFFAFLPLYFVVLLAWRGQTVGKMAMDIKVVRSDGRPVGLGTAILRLIGYMLSTVLLFVGFLMIAFDGQRRAFHDRLADTLVVEPR